MKRNIYNTQTASIIIPQGSTLQRHYFPDLPNLRNVHLLGIETFFVNAVTDDPNNVAIANNNLMQCSYLTLVNAQSDQFVYRFPLANLNRTYNTNTDPHVEKLNEFAGMSAIFTKSFIEIADVTTISGAQDEAVLFNIYYRRREYKGVKYQD